MTLTVEMWPIDKPIPYIRNPRKISDAAIAKVAGSLKEFGWRQPIVVDRDGVIVVGHTRWLAARRLGMTEVPVHVALDLSPTKAKAYRITDNRVGEESAWDDDLLKLEFDDLKMLDFDLDGIGFDSDELAALLADQTDGLTDPDEAPEPPVNPVSRLGDVWILGRHRLVCGDSTDAETVSRVLNGVKPHLMTTDPPYGVDYDPTWRGKAKSSDGKRTSLGVHAKGQVLNDDNADWRAAWELFPGDVAYVWHAGLHAATVADSLIASGFTLRSQIMWAKNNFAIGRGDYHWQHEPCWYAVRGKGHWSGDRKQSTVWNIPKPQKSETGHSTQKPVECMKRPIENNSSPGQAIYEPFAGSGTTIIAGEMTGRAVHAIELNPAYVDVACNRWMAFTGQTAVLEETGQTFADVCEERYAGGEWADNCRGSYDDAVAAVAAARAEGR